MTADDRIDKAADRLEQAAERAAEKGGVRAKLARELAEDALFLRKLKPSLMKARLRGELPTNGTPAPPAAPSGPQLGTRPPAGGAKTGGPNPFAVVGGALAVGVLLAKLVDWRGHAHPRL